jgi:type II restriction enzyme
MEKVAMSYRNHLRQASDLKTPPADTRAGFVEMAVERSARAVPYVSEAKALHAAASNTESPEQLLGLSAIRSGLISAAGISDKASGHMLDEDKTQAINDLIANHLETAGSSYIEELVYRFLLTKGDTLGGSMRNVTGTLAGRKLIRGILSALNLAGVPYSWRASAKSGWISSTPEDAGIEAQLRSLAWSNCKGPRVLLFNCNAPMVGKNIDYCLLSCDPATYEESIGNPNSYIALGELKGGNDPAGADEHWKTASKALMRIRAGFASNEKLPSTFFIGAAIVADMANEIWKELEEGTLTNAANLTNPNQLASVCSWLIGV